MKLPIFLQNIILLLAVSILSAEEIADPISDFLNLPVEARYSDMSEIDHVTAVRCDLEGNGNEVLFLGTRQPWTGASREVLFTAYQKKGVGYVRLTSEDRELVSYIHFLESRSIAYYGNVEEYNAQGLLICGDHPGSRPSDDGIHYSLSFCHIVDDKLVIDHQRPLDRGNPVDEVFLSKILRRGN